nr:hypothetical protein GCM10017745_07190 [Saccharothrix mutabilis subsp. capreolus]
MTDPRQWRVSDAEREHVVGVLQKAIGRGLITLDEFTERADTALAAKTGNSSTGCCWTSAASCTPTRPGWWRRSSRWS